MKKNNILLLIYLTVLLVACSGKKMKNHSKLGREYAERELKSALEGIGHNVVESGKAIITDSLTVTAIAEPLLFSIYGQDNILRQKPYEIYHINSHWVLTGTLQEGMRGGTFLIIIDDQNCKVLKLTHGK